MIASTYQLRPWLGVSTVLALVACHAREVTQPLRIVTAATSSASPADRARPPAPPPSPWVGPACDAPAHPTLTTVEPGGLLRWSAMGNVLAVSRATRTPFRLRSGVAANDSVTLIDVATRRTMRPHFRGVASPLAGSDSFLISGEQSAVVTLNGTLLSERVADGGSGEEARALPERTRQLADEKRAIPLERPAFASQVDAAVGRDRNAKTARLGVWRAGRQLTYLKLEPGADPSHWAISDRAERVAVADGKQLWLFDVATGKQRRALSTKSPILELAFRPGSLELALSTEKGVELWGDRDAAEPLAGGIVEPGTWSVEPSPAMDAIAAHVGGEIVGFSLLDGNARPSRRADAPSTGSYAGLSWQRDGQPVARSDRDPVLSPDGRFELSFAYRGALLRRAGSTEARSLDIPPIDVPEASPSLQGVAFSSDGNRVLGYGSLNLPRSGSYRVTEWSTIDGSVMWSYDAEFVGAAEATRGGWLIEEYGAITRYEGHRSVFAERAKRGYTLHGYSAATDVLGVIREKALVLVDVAGKERVLALPFDGEVTGIAFDEGGRRVALGTALGLHVLSVEDGSELSSTALGTRVEPLRWRKDLLLALRLSQTSSPEQALFLLDTRSGASISVGFARVNGGPLQSYALASNGQVDGAPEILAALRGGEHGDVVVPAECARPGLLQQWLGALSR